MIKIDNHKRTTSRYLVNVTACFVTRTFGNNTDTCDHKNSVPSGEEITEFGENAGFRVQSRILHEPEIINITEDLRRSYVVYGVQTKTWSCFNPQFHLQRHLLGTWAKLKLAVCWHIEKERHRKIRSMPSSYWEISALAGRKWHGKERNITTGDTVLVIDRHISTVTLR